MTMNEIGKNLAVFAILLIMVLGLGYFFKASADCQEKGGHFAKDAYTGIYKCYDREVK